MNFKNGGAVTAVFIVARSEPVAIRRGIADTERGPAIP